MDPTFLLVTVSAVVVVVIGILIAVGVKFLERQSDRDAEASRLQLDILDALRRDPELRGATVLPVVTVNWRGSVTVELSGTTTTPELGDRLLQAVEREILRHPAKPRVVSRIGLPPDQPTARRTA
jgi:hypothetical protein